MLTCLEIEVQNDMKHLRIQDEIYYSIGLLYSKVGQPSKFAQLYIYDAEHKIKNKGKVITIGVKIETLREL